MIVGAEQTGRRFFAPEVIQTSMMDCGPASLKCLLEGFGVHVGYGRLREACQTDVDGTSIDVMEDVAGQLGLDAEQVMVPADRVLSRQVEMLPAIVVVQRPHAPVHFVVVWRRHGKLLQVMDPGVGRIWVSQESFLRDLYSHQARVPAEAFREYAGSDGFLRPLERSLRDLGISTRARRALLDEACADAGWRSLATLDAATRMVGAVVRAGGLAAGGPASAALSRLARASSESDSIPESFWTVRPAPPREDDDSDMVLLRGAVLVTIRGRKAVAVAAEPMAEAGAAPALSAEMLAALHEAPPPTWSKLFEALRSDGVSLPAQLVWGIFVGAAVVAAQALVLRALLDLGRSLGTGAQRLGAMGVVLALVLVQALFALASAAGLLRMGRKLELRLRAAFAAKVPRTADRYFHSRLISDMAERAHSVIALRALPATAAGLLSSVFQLLFTMAGLIWLMPSTALPATLVVVATAVLSLWSQTWLSERDLRARSHAGTLTKFYLDALLGIACIRAHGAQRSLQREQESVLVQWTDASLRLQRAVVAVDAVQGLAGLGLAIWLIFGQVAAPGHAGTVLLAAYWALQLPALGQAVATGARQVPTQRNVMLRLLEPLSAPEEGSEEPSAAAAPPGAEGSGAARVELSGVSVRAGGHTLLDGVDLSLEPGSHTAIVGKSGAGKSTLVGLLLGWHRASSGSIRVDGAPLDAGRLGLLRRDTAWVDPSVQLYNRSLIDNLLYGAGGAVDVARDLGPAMEAAELRELLERLPEGLQTTLGESGALVSGGEGQRIRLGRAMLRKDPRLVILDEPFRGLDRDRRHLLLERARQLWRPATMICVTHDVGETVRFERVLVVDGGRIVEDGTPEALLAREGSRYRAMLAAEESVRERMWSSAAWRRLRVERGALTERSDDSATEAGPVSSSPRLSAGDA